MTGWPGLSRGPSNNKLLIIKFQSSQILTVSDFPDKMPRIVRKNRKIVTQSDVAASAAAEENLNHPTAKHVEGSNQPTYKNGDSSNQPTYKNVDSSNQPTYKNGDNSNQPTDKNGDSSNQPTDKNVESSEFLKPHTYLALLSMVKGKTADIFKNW